MRFSKQLGQKVEETGGFAQEVADGKQLLFDLAESGLAQGSDVKEILGALVRMNYSEAAAYCGTAIITVKKRLADVEPVLRVGNYPFYSLAQIERMNKEIMHSHTKKARGEKVIS